MNNIEVNPLYFKTDTKYSFKLGDFDPPIVKHHEVEEKVEKTIKAPDVQPQPGVSITLQRGS